MKLGVLTNVVGNMPFEEALKYFKSMGIQMVEIGCGGFPGKDHCDPEVLLNDEAKFQEFCDVIKKYDMEVSAFSCHGNPVHPNKELAAAYDKDMRNAVLMAEKYGLHQINCFSGCPGDSETSQYPNWVTCPWPDDFGKILEYQWKVLIDYWKDFVAFAKAHGVNKIALELHPGFCVYNTQTLMKLREAVGPMVGMNLDPSHLMWRGGDPVTAVHKLGADRIYHVHAKDVRIERNYIGPDGVLDTKTIDQFAKRTWNYVALGHGHDVSWWKEFLSCLSMEGYDGPISQEMEDLTMPALTGLKKSTTVLKEAMPCDL